MLILILIANIKAQAQSDELLQLLLNVEKLSQLKSILSDMKTGYQIYQQGYGTISNLSKGNFDLHHIYLTGLLAISPTIQNYGRVAEVISQQTSVVQEYKRSLGLFRQSGSFSASELTYMANVYKQLINQSGDNLDELDHILTAGKLRMSDDDRLRAIDRVYSSSSDQLQFLRYFNRQGILLSLQRSKDLNDSRALKKLYGLN
jgi:hypothetical protein